MAELEITAVDAIVSSEILKSKYNIDVVTLKKEEIENIANLLKTTLANLKELKKQASLNKTE